jgi:A/G-specific adenine glycosylase
VANYGGDFPSCFEELKKLPGIGDYTAAAIASIAFGESVAVVDGNVYRVLSRMFGIDTPTNTPQGKKVFFELANTLVTKNDANLFNQGIMEFGALFCTPQNPSCSECIFKASCVAKKNVLQNVLPVKNRIKKITKRYFYYFVMQKGKSFMMKKREGKDIWHGLYDFYLVEKKRSYNPEKILLEDDTLKKAVRSKINVDISGVYKHVLSHQIIFSRFIQLKTTKETVNGSGLKLYSSKKISQLPKPVLISRFLADYELL